MGDIQLILFVVTISHPSREVGCVLFAGGFSPRGHEDVYGIILVALGFCKVDVVSRVSRVVGGGAWLDGELSVAPRTSAWLGETKLVSASWV